MAAKTKAEIRSEVIGEFHELAWTLRDGIELNCSWDEWQKRAREALSRFFPEECASLPSPTRVAGFRDDELIRKDREITDLKKRLMDKEKEFAQALDAVNTMEGHTKSIFVEYESARMLLTRILDTGIMPKPLTREMTIAAERILSKEPFCHWCPGDAVRHIHLRKRYEQRFGHLPKVRAWILGKEVK